MIKKYYLNNLTLQFIKILASIIETSTLSKKAYYLKHILSYI